jgi:hypothetical protein
MDLYVFITWRVLFHGRAEGIINKLVGSMPGGTFSRLDNVNLIPEKAKLCGQSCVDTAGYLKSKR